jgi:hypothetical protein
MSTDDSPANEIADLEKRLAELDRERVHVLAALDYKNPRPVCIENLIRFDWVTECKLSTTRPPNIYSSSAPNTLPVLGLTMWTCLQAKQVTPSHVSPLSSDPLSANQPCTRSPVLGQRKRTVAMVEP